MEAQQSRRRYLERAGKSDTCGHAFLRLSSLVSSLFGRQALNAELQEATMPTTQQLRPAHIPHHLLRLQPTPCLVCCVANLLNNHSNSRGGNVFFVTFQINTLDTFSRPTDVKMAISFSLNHARGKSFASRPWPDCKSILANQPQAV